MSLEWILKLVLFGVLHWVLAIMLLNDVAGRERVLGGTKWPCGVHRAGDFSGFRGLPCHPRIFYDSEDK
ncbi:MAG: hypothetical protein HY673_04680 [Chloroflexi bacterium]|nr:hypothetical protein [Chloroflexota bacterium]